MRYVALLLLVAGCASAGDDSITADDDLTIASAERNFHPRQRCWGQMATYEAEIDLSDRAVPRYRIRHSKAHDEVVGKQNINLHFRDGTIWKSPDSLVSRPSSKDLEGVDMNDRELVVRRSQEADARDPWDPLPVPKDIIDKAFQVTKDGIYNLRSWEVILNSPSIPDTACRQDFYFVPA